MYKSPAFIRGLLLGSTAGFHTNVRQGLEGRAGHTAHGGGGGGGSYPVWMTRQAHKDAYDLVTTSGSRIAKASLTPIASASRPAGVSAPSAGAVTVSATSAMSSVDFDGNSIFVINNGDTFTLTDGWLKNSANAKVLRVGFTSGAGNVGFPNIDLEHVTIDCSSAPYGGGLASVDNNPGGCNATLNFVRIYNAPRDPIVWNGGVLTMTNTLVGAFATNTDGTWNGHPPPGTDHNEGVYLIDGGTLHMTGCLLDLAFGDPFLGGLTGLVFLRAQTSDITATITDTIMRGAVVAANALCCMQAKAVGGNVDLTVTGCALELGSQGFIITSLQDGHTITVHDGGGNVNYSTGAPLDVTLFNRGPGISGTPAATGFVGTPYSFAPTLVTPVPAATVTHQVTSGALPPGLTLNASTGAISGTPTTPGTYSGIVIKGFIPAGWFTTLPTFSITIS